MIKLNVVRNEAELKKVITNEGLNKSAKMKELFKLGMDIKEIASLMEVRYNFVYNVISNEILKDNINENDIDRSKKESKKDKIVEMYRNGSKIIEICKELKCNYNSVWNVVNKLDK